MNFDDCVIPTVTLCWLSSMHVLPSFLQLRSQLFINYGVFLNVLLSVSMAFKIYNKSGSFALVGSGAFLNIFFQLQQYMESQS